MIISLPQRRLIALASTVFFITSVYLCTTRLFAMDFAPEASYSVDTTPGRQEESFNEAAGSSKTSKVEIEVELTGADMPMSYGSYARPGFDNITLLRALPREYVPTLKNKRRLIVIGDVHGMIGPLNTLLKQVHHNAVHDHVITVGDMVNKGTSSAAVVSRFMELGASAVRGNHEDRVLLAWAAMNAREGVEAKLETAAAEERRGESRDLRTARSLTTEQLEWLKALPVILTLDPLSIFIVHAGLVPGVELQHQDPWAVMNMRTFRYPREESRKNEEELKNQEADEKADEEQRKVEEEERKEKEAEQTVNSNARRREAGPNSANTVPDHDVWIPTEARDGDKWAEIWNREQRRLDESLRHTVIYGHDAKLGYQEGPYTFGLDSSCVKGGTLTAFIIEADKKTGWRHSTVQVPCSGSSS